MAIPDPPKRRDRKALLYLEELAARVLQDPRVPARDAASASFYAQALVVVAFFSEAERQLLYQVIQSHTEGACLDELQAACACDEEDQLCLVLEQMMVQNPSRDPLTDRLIIDQMMHVIEQENWRPVAQELREREFTADNFVWWAFDPDR